jgi:hypothetical protein
MYWILTLLNRLELEYEQIIPVPCIYPLYTSDPRKELPLLKKEYAKHFPTDKLSRPKTKTMLGVRLVATRAVARARESRYRPRVDERRAREGRRATALALERPPGREAGEREARARRGTGGARARARATWRDLTGPRVAI